jgi:hypothetical protein
VVEAVSAGKGVFRRIGNSLVPTGDTSREALFAVRDGDLCYISVRTPRNPEQHNLFWALCQLCAEADDDTKENVKKWLMYRLKFVDTWFEPNGNMHLETQSIAFESMPQAEFNVLFQGSVGLIAERLQTTPRVVQERFEEMLKGRRGRAGT